MSPTEKGWRFRFTVSTYQIRNSYLKQIPKYGVVDAAALCGGHQ
jgi:hypothetical protein